MRLSSRFTLLLAIILTACAPVTAPANSPALAESTNLAAGTTTAPADVVAPLMAAAMSPPKPLLISYRGFQFSIDNDLAASASGEIVEALVGDRNRLASPEHIRFTFDDQAPSSDFDPRQPQLLIYPAKAYVNIAPAASVQMGLLQSILTERKAPQRGSLPLLPLSLETETLHAQVRLIDFEGGSGLRYIANYGQASDLFYTYQGLSSDGEYYIALFYPVSTDALPPTPIPDVSATESAATDMVTSSPTVAAATQLDRLAGDDFLPNLAWLDALVSSLTLPSVDPSLRESQPPKAIVDQLQGQGLPSLQALWDALQLGPQDIFSPNDQLNVDLFDLNVNGSRDEYQIVVISDEARQNWQYLLFRAVGVRWWFSGQINLPFQAFIPPSYQVVEDGQNAWMVVDRLAQSGAEITRYEEGWFLLSRGQIVQVLDYPIEGYQMAPEGPCSVRYRVAPQVLHEEEGLAVRLPFSIAYLIYGDGKDSTNISDTYDLFSIDRDIFYRWQSGPSAFQFDPARSNLTQEQVDAGFYFGADTFYAFARDELKTLAQAGEGLQKRWLKQYLKGLQSSPEIEQLLKSMGG